MKSELEQILSLLSGDLNYDRVAKAKGLVKNLLYFKETAELRKSKEIITSDDYMAHQIFHYCKKVIFQYDKGSAVTIRREAFTTRDKTKLYLKKMDYDISDKRLRTICLYYEKISNENFYFFQRKGKGWEGQEFTPPALPFLTLRTTLRTTLA